MNAKFLATLYPYTLPHLLAIKDTIFEFALYLIMIMLTVVRNTNIVSTRLLIPVNKLHKC